MTYRRSSLLKALPVVLFSFIATPCPSPVVLHSKRKFRASHNCGRALFAFALLLSIVGTTLCGRTVYAQEKMAALDLVVVDGSTGTPLANAQVIIGTRGGTTDSAGTFHIERLPAGETEVTVRHVGYATRALSLHLGGGSAGYITVPLEIAPVFLPEVRVSAERGTPRPRSRELQQFYARTRTGAGQYLTRAEIERRQPRNLSDLFRMLPGVVLISGPVGDKPLMEAKASANMDRNGRARECPIQYFVDGTPFTPTRDGIIGLDIPLKDIEGIEIYRRGTGVPAKFHRLGNNCGVILIWKKERI